MAPPYSLDSDPTEDIEVLRRHMAPLLEAARSLTGAGGLRLETSVDSLPVEVVVGEVPDEGLPRHELAGLGTLQLADVADEPAGRVVVLLSAALGRESLQRERRRSDRMRRVQLSLVEDLGRHQERLAASNRRLLESNEALQEFVYVASHDLREPLRSIAGFSQLLDRKFGDQLGDQGREYLRYIGRGVSRMQSNLTDLLGISRLGSAALKLEEVDLGPLTVEVMESLREAIGEADAMITWRGLPTVRADRAQLRQVLQNLVGNAIKFARPGVPPQVTVAGSVEGEDVRVEVRDNGIGIPQELQADVFGLFRRVHSGREVAGSGVGLAIVRRIVLRHGGSVGLSSTPGEGSVFWFTLPRAGAPEVGL